MLLRRAPEAAALSLLTVLLAAGCGTVKSPTEAPAPAEAAMAIAKPRAVRTNLMVLSFPRCA